MKFALKFLPLAASALLTACPSKEPLSLHLGQCVTEPALKSRLDRPLDTVGDRDTLELRVNGLIVEPTDAGGRPIGFPEARHVRLSLDAGCVAKVDTDHEKNPMALGELPHAVKDFLALADDPASADANALLAGLTDKADYPLAAPLKWGGNELVVVAHRDRAPEPDAPLPDTYWVSASVQNQAITADLFRRGTAARLKLGKPDGPVLIVQYPKE